MHDYEDTLHEVLNRVYRNTDDCEMRISKDCYKLIREALEKQIPKKPDFEGDGYDDKGNIIYDTWICPCCKEHYEVYYDDYKHCPNCGQVLDWSDDCE